MNVAILGASDTDAAGLLEQLQTRLGNACCLSVVTLQILHQPQDRSALADLDLVLLLGLELHGSPQLRHADQTLRTALNQSAIPYAPVHGNAAARLDSALQAIHYALGTPRATPRASPWKWACEKCSDPDCEHRLFSDLLKGA
jgi:hypothetical protein